MTSAKKVEPAASGWMASWFGITPAVIRKDSDAGGVAEIVKDYLKRQKQAPQEAKPAVHQRRAPSKS